MDDFSERTAVVTGATRGIGRSVCEALLRNNCTVIGIYRGDTAAAEEFERLCGEISGRLTLARCDVADHDAVARLYGAIEAEHETIDILVNNAGIRRDAIVALMNQDQWQTVLDTNLTGTFNMSKGAVPLMLKQKYGRIVTITSPVAHLGIQGQANYGAAKAGQVGFTRSLAKEVARKNITANCVAPGFIATDLIADLDDRQVAAYKKLVPIRRFGTVEEVADAVLFLASERASYITGATLEVSGGL